MIYFWYIQKGSLAFHTGKKLELSKNCKPGASVWLMTLHLARRMKQKASEPSKIHLKVSSDARAPWDSKQCTVWKVTGKTYTIGLCLEKSSA